MKKSNLLPGFTLIELLVVISIIGVLASVVLSSVNTARAKGSDSAIKTNLANMRSQAAILYDNAGCYSANAACTTGTTTATACTGGTVGNLWKNTQINEALLAAGKASTGGGVGVSTCVQDISNGVWAISTPLKSTPTQSWCIDSSGSSKQRLGAVTLSSC